jgi:hypothetical protein
MALDLLKNPELREAVVAESQKRARERLSFEAVRLQLAKFFDQLQGTAASRPPRPLTGYKAAARIGVFPDSRVNDL